MNSRNIAPLALLMTLATLTACTQKPSDTPDPDTVQSSSDTTITVTEVPSMGTGTSTGEPSSSVVTKTEKVTYNNPGGSDEVEFTLSANEGVVTAVSVTPLADNEISKKRQESFATAISGEIVGKKLKDLDLNAVGGSSLTTGAFKKFITTF